MDIVNYLADTKARIEQRSDLVKDPNVFEFHYIPTEPLVRDESKTLIDAMMQFNVMGLRDHYAVIGSRG